MMNGKGARAEKTGHGGGNHDSLAGNERATLKRAAELPLFAALALGFGERTLTRRMVDGDEVVKSWEFHGPRDPINTTKVRIHSSPFCGDGVNTKVRYLSFALFDGLGHSMVNGILHLIHPYTPNPL